MPAAGGRGRSLASDNWFCTLVYVFLLAPLVGIFWLIRCVLADNKASAFSWSVPPSLGSLFTQNTTILALVYLFIFYGVYRAGLLITYLIDKTFGEVTILIMLTFFSLYTHQKKVSMQKEDKATIDPQL